jgi:hypothetical protein
MVIVMEVLKTVMNRLKAVSMEISQKQVSHAPKGA